MDVKDYCEGSKSELMEWKAKVKDIFSKLDGIPIGDKEALYPVANELQTIINEINDQIEVLRQTSCKRSSTRLTIKLRFSIRSVQLTGIFKKKR